MGVPPVPVRELLLHGATDEELSVEAVRVDVEVGQEGAAAAMELAIAGKEGAESVASSFAREVSTVLVKTAARRRSRVTSMRCSRSNRASSAALNRVRERAKERACCGFLHRQ